MASDLKVSLNPVAINLSAPSRYATFIIIAMLQADAGFAGAWSFTPSISVTETYIDNAVLAPPGSKVEEYITQMDPRFTAQASGRRAEASLDYRLQNLLYARESDRNSTRQQLSAKGNAELVKSFFFVDVASTLSQQFASPKGGIALDNLSITSNRRDVSTYSVSPYLLRNLGDLAAVQVRYGYDKVNYSDGDTFDTDNTDVLGQVRSGARFDRLEWNLGFHRKRVDSKDTPDVIFEVADLKLRYHVNPGLSLIASGGGENNEFKRSQGREGPRGSHWNAGFGWNPGRRTTLEILAGRRFFGNTGILKFNHSRRHTSWNVEYNEDVITSTQVQLEGRVFDDSGVPVFRTDTPELTTEVFLRRRLSAGFTGYTPRSNLHLGIFNDRRKFQITEENERVFGGNISWDWRFAARTYSTFSGSWQQQRFRGTGVEDNLWQVKLGIRRQMRRKMLASLDYRYVQRDPTALVNKYTQNTVSASIDIRF